LGKHDIDIGWSKDTLQGIECQARKFRLYQVWSILHNGSEENMAIITTRVGVQIKV
jgi:hypothetical protein